MLKTRRCTLSAWPPRLHRAHPFREFTLRFWRSSSLKLQFDGTVTPTEAHVMHYAIGCRNRAGRYWERGEVISEKRNGMALRKEEGEGGDVWRRLESSWRGKVRKNKEVTTKRECNRRHSFKVETVGSNRHYIISWLVLLVFPYTEILIKSAYISDSSGFRIKIARYFALL